MKRHLRIFCLALAATFCIATGTAHAGTNDFSFESFAGDYTLSRDSQHISILRVTERLVANFPATDQNHGIIRAIPKTANGHSVHLRILGVTDGAGRQLQYQTDSQNQNTVLKIGDPDAFVHGRQTYVISYTADNVTSQPGGFDGHFWDVNGDQWPQTFASVTATVHLSNDLASQLQPNRTRCFTGTRGSTTQNCTLNTTGNSVTVAATGPLSANQTLTYELRFNQGTFAVYAIPQAELYRRIWLGLGLGVAPVALALGFGLWLWHRRGRDPQGRGVIVPEYVPPKNLSVLMAGALLNEGFKPKALSAQILDLAVRRFLKVHEVTDKKLIGTGRHFELELLAPPGPLQTDEASAVSMLFGENAQPGSRVNLKELSNKLHKQAAAIGKEADRALVSAGLTRTTPSKARTPLATAGWVLAVAGFFFIPYSLGIMAAGAILLAISHFMPARTAAGVEVKDELLGLKHYLKVAESERIAIMQSPHGKLIEKIDVNDSSQVLKLYERLLPYAMLFGLEKDWAKALAPLYATPPDWYAGGSAFNAGAFAGSISGFADAAGTSFSAPSSSSSGGFAGGGGGGGGGGGW